MLTMHKQGHAGVVALPHRALSGYGILAKSKNACQCIHFPAFLNSASLLALLRELMTKLVLVQPKVLYLAGTFHID